MSMWVECSTWSIRDRAPQPGDDWAADYPFEGDLAAIGAFLRATEQNLVVAERTPSISA